MIANVKKKMKETKGMESLGGVRPPAGKRKQHTKPFPAPSPPHRATLSPTT